MLTKLFERYQYLIHSWTVVDFDQAGPNLKIKAQVLFHNGSMLHVRQIILDQNTFKYSYHWQNKKGDLICRWDNSPHWQNIPSFPHHKHIAINNQTHVRESHGGDLEKVFEEIAYTIKSGSSD